MKTTIVKYELNIKKKQNIDVGNNMPAVLSVSEQNGKIVMWISLEVDFPGSFNIDVYIVKTGDSYEPRGKYAGTAVMPSGEEYHVFTEHKYIRADN